MFHSRFYIFDKARYILPKVLFAIAENGFIEKQSVRFSCRRNTEEWKMPADENFYWNFIRHHPNPWIENPARALIPVAPKNCISICHTPRGSAVARAQLWDSHFHTRIRATIYIFHARSSTALAPASRYRRLSECIQMVPLTRDAIYGDKERTAIINMP